MSDEDIEDEDSLDEILGTLDEEIVLQDKVKIGLHANVYHTISPVKITKVFELFRNPQSWL